MVSLFAVLAIAFCSFAALLIVGIGVFEAPWPVLLGILVAGLLSIQWALQQGKAIASSDSPQSIADEFEQKNPSRVASQGNEEPQLKYRGIAYGEHNHRDSSLENDSSARDLSLDHDPESITLSGVYRGRPWQHEQHVEPETHDETSPDVVYRGQKINTSHEH
ncbi:MAG: hypothetical protein AAF327_11180 [Cyanobacteria bacterium P01_A01_bin.37]